jgi:hypothetical protein
VTCYLQSEGPSPSLLLLFPRLLCVLLVWYCTSLESVLGNDVSIFPSVYDSPQRRPPSRPCLLPDLRLCLRAYIRQLRQAPTHSSNIARGDIQYYNSSDKYRKYHKHTGVGNRGEKSTSGEISKAGSCILSSTMHIRLGPPFHSHPV